MYMYILSSTEKLGNTRVEAPEVTQTEVGQKHKLRVVLDKVNAILQYVPQLGHEKWSVDSNIHTFILHITNV